MSDQIAFRGCAPYPLAAYLKALGILRLVSLPKNNVSGVAADPDARGWWDDETFHLATTLDPDGLRRFFLHEYAPTPIIAPWNGGSGFYAGDNRDGFDPLAAETVAPRFRGLSEAIRRASAIIAEWGLTKRPEGEVKQRLVARLRAELEDDALVWVDAALALTGEELRYPQLLGTGGNDGRLDFTNNFLGRLVSGKRAKPGLFDAESGIARDGAARFLDEALFDSLWPDALAAPIGQFSPGSAGGANASTGYTKGSAINPWDYVLTLEGSLAFAGAATRRHEGARRASGSFPFTVRPTGAGSGAVQAADEDDARAEFWAPLWRSRATWTEIEALVAEGRAVLDGRTARDGLEFARAAASLGTSRGFSEFERYGFLKRAGNQYLATRLGRSTAHASRGAKLLADLEFGGWLERVRRVGRSDSSPAAARIALKRVEDSILSLVDSEAEAAPVGAVLVALQEVVAWVASSPAYRDALGAPPPGLSAAWLRSADDGSSEFRVAAALAGLGHRTPQQATEPGSLPGVEQTASAEPRQAVSVANRTGAALPMAAHWAPVSEETLVAGGRRAWLSSARSATVVWGAGSLVQNLVAVLERRLVEMAVRPLPTKPLASPLPARLSDIARFLAGDFDDGKCADLLGGLIWIRAGEFRWTQPLAQQERDYELPFAYAALKPIFSTDEALRRTKTLDATGQMPIPPGVVTRLRTARGDDQRRIGEAVRAAMMRARGSGLPSPFDSRLNRPGARLAGGLAADRLAASLLIPIHDRALTALVQRAYPNGKEELHDAT